MTDSPAADSAPWPVPAATLASEDLLETLESMTFLTEPLEFQAVNLIEKRPAKDDPTHEVWVHDLAVLIDALETVVDKVKEVQAEAAEAFARAMPFPCPSNVSFADTRPLVPRFPKNRTAWHNDDLKSAVSAAIVACMDAPPATTESVVGMVEKVVSISGSNAKTTGLRALGIDPDDYCHSEKVRPTVQVVK